jgi:hypothetical protein
LAALGAVIRTKASGRVSKKETRAGAQRVTREKRTHLHKAELKLHFRLSRAFNEPEPERKSPLVSDGASFRHHRAKRNRKETPNDDIKHN